MDIHKPTPVRRWQKLVSEIGTIVVGVLIALAAGQTVDMLHWRQEVETERQALLAEVRDNLSGVQARILLEPCVERRLSELKVVFDRKSRGEPLGITGLVGLPVPRGGSRGSWNIALAGQGITHMPHAEQLDFSNAFSNYENWDAIRTDERTAWVRLGVLDRPVGLTDTDWALLRQAFAEVRASSARVRAVAPFVLSTASMGEKPEGVSTPERTFKAIGYGQEICQPLLSS